MDYPNNEKLITNNEYDYSNIVPIDKYILCLAECLGHVYNEFLKLTEEDEEKNKEFKIEYKEYLYKKSYSTTFDINIQDKNYHTITCHDIETFKTAITSGHLNNINKLEIKLHLDFKRGKTDLLEEHENLYIITFKPYEITFRRTSNYKEKIMDSIEADIKKILDTMPAINTIFCTK